MNLKSKHMAEFLYEHFKDKNKMEIVYNALRTPDGTLLESKYRHDCQFHLDENGKEYMIDGGLDYVRATAHGDEKLITITLDDDHETVREYVQWGTYGPDGNQPLKLVRLKDMDTDHIKAVLETQGQIRPSLRTAMMSELDYRDRLWDNETDK